jgi:hypothetical protein
MVIYSLESSCNIGVKITFFNHQVVSFLRFFFSFFFLFCVGVWVGVGVGCFYVWAHSVSHLS